MRWLAYILLALSLVVLGVLIGTYWPAGPAVPANEPPRELGPPPRVVVPAEKESGIDVLVDGKRVPPEEEEVLRRGFHKMLEEAVSKAVSKVASQVWEELQQKLRMADDVERKLLVVGLSPWEYAGPKPEVDDDSPMAISVHLIRPGKPNRAAETLEATFEKPVIVRFTRASAAIDRPIGVITMTGTHAGRLWQRERVLVYHADGEWRAVGTEAALPPPRVVPDRGP